jgi:hypothetical protein
MKNSRCLCEAFFTKGKLGGSNGKSHDTYGGTGTALLALVELVLIDFRFSVFL